MDKKTENPLYKIARRYASELDLTSIVMVEQAMKLCKSLYSREEWLEDYHRECQQINANYLGGLVSEEFFDSILTAEIWHLLEMKLGAAKSSYTIAKEEILSMQKQPEAGKYETFFGLPMRKAYEKLLERTRLLQYPWLSEEENLVLLLTVAYNQWHHSEPGLS